MGIQKIQFSNKCMSCESMLTALIEVGGTASLKKAGISLVCNKCNQENNLIIPEA